MMYLNNTDMQGGRKCIKRVTEVRNGRCGEEERKGEGGERKETEKENESQTHSEWHTLY